MPVTVGRERSVAAVNVALKTEDKMILVVAQRDPAKENPGLDDLHTIGTKAIVKQVGRTEDGVIQALIQGIERVALLKVEQAVPYLMVQARRLELPTDNDREVQALQRAIQDSITDLPRRVQAPGIEEATAAFRNEENPATRAYGVGWLRNLTVRGEADITERFFHGGTAGITLCVSVQGNTDSSTWREDQ